jgi:hypothetical protein
MFNWDARAVTNFVNILKIYQKQCRSATGNATRKEKHVFRRSVLGKKGEEVAKITNNTF